MKNERGDVMAFRQTCELTCELKCLPDVSATDSIFKNAEQILISSSKCYKALKYFGTYEQMGKYVSVMDFLFVSCFPKWKRKCFKYYDDDGPPLKDYPDMTPELIAEYDELLCLILYLAVRIVNWETFKRKRKGRWSMFMIQVKWLIMERKSIIGGDINAIKVR